MAFFRKKQEPSPAVDRKSSRGGGSQAPDRISQPKDGDSEPIRSLQMRRDQELRALGEIYFAAAAAGRPDPRALARKVREIQQIEQRLSALRQPPPQAAKAAASENRPARPRNCSCGHPLSNRDLFCPQCGSPTQAPAEKPCPACHRPVDPSAVYCKHCGASIQTPTRLRVRHPFTGQEASFDFQAGAAGLVNAPAPAYAEPTAPPVAPDESAGEDEKRRWMRELERFARPPQADTQAFLARGREFLQVGRFREAAAEFEACMLQNPRDGRAQYYLGVSRYKNGEVDAAMDAFQRSTRLDRSNPDAHNDLGLCYVKKGIWRDAMQSYQDALKIAPNHSDAHYNLAQLYLQQVIYPDAIRHFQSYLQYSPRARDFKQVTEMIERLQAASAAGGTIPPGSALPSR